MTYSETTRQQTFVYTLAWQNLGATDIPLSAVRSVPDTNVLNPHLCCAVSVSAVSLCLASSTIQGLIVTLIHSCAPLHLTSILSCVRSSSTSSCLRSFPRRTQGTGQRGKRTRRFVTASSQLLETSSKTSPHRKNLYGCK
jgi:hypothetical protein